MPIYSPASSFLFYLSPLFFLLLGWSLFWKAWALWVAARRNEKIWYIILFVVNTLGILEIIYLFIYCRFSTKIGSEQ